MRRRLFGVFFEAPSGHFGLTLGYHIGVTYERFEHLFFFPLYMFATSVVYGEIRAYTNCQPKVQHVNKALNLDSP